MQKANKTIMQELMQRSYTPDSDGPVKIFKLMEHDVYRIHILKFAYRWDTLIVHCQTTIRDSNRHNGSSLRIIEDEWVRQEPADSSSFTKLELCKQWERFKAYYIKELKKLATDRPGGIAHNANAMEERMTSLTSDMLTLNDNQIRLSTAYSSLQPGVPSVVDTLNKSSTVGTMSGTHVAASALTEMAADVQALKQLVTALLAGTCQPAPRRPIPRPTTPAPPAHSTTTTYLSLSCNTHFHPPIHLNIHPLQCKPNPNCSNLRVSFTSSLICGPSRRRRSPAALHICNKLVDIYPPRAIIDSGASDHFVHSSYSGDNPQSKQHGLPVQCANGMIMRSTGTDLLSLPRLPTNARGCHKFDEVTTSLFSVGKLCDSGLHVTFSNTNVVVTDTAPVSTGTVVMEGQRNGGIYSTPMSQPATLPRVPTGSISGTASLATNATKAYEVKTVDALINYYHMTLGSPPISKWINCINKSWFKSWHGLSADRVRKFCTKKEQTTLGNQRMISKSIKTTKVIDHGIIKQV
jgi:hypothetical protein